MVKEDVTNRDDKERYISVREAAEILGYSRIHVVRLINSGQISAKKIGRSFVVDRESLPSIFSKKISIAEKQEVDRAVSRVVKEYGEALRKLGKE